MTIENFKSIFHSIWWAIATLSKVGYGDVYPNTLGGKISSSNIILIGIVAIPTGLIASSINQNIYNMEFKEILLVILLGVFAVLGIISFIFNAKNVAKLDAEVRGVGEKLVRKIDLDDIEVGKPDFAHEFTLSTMRKLHRRKQYKELKNLLKPLAKAFRNPAKNNNIFELKIL